MQKSNEIFILCIFIDLLVTFKHFDACAIFPYSYRDVSTSVEFPLSSIILTVRTFNGRVTACA